MADRKLALVAALTSTTVILGACRDRPLEPVFLNQGFELATPRAQPFGWYVEVDSGEPVVSIERTPAPAEGEHELYIRLPDDAAVALYTPLLPGEACVKTLHSTASARTVGDQISVQLFHLEPTRHPGFGDALVGPSDGRQRLSASISAGEDCLARDVIVGFVVSGRGEVWLDDLRVSRDGFAYPTSALPPSPDPGATDVTTLRELAIDLGPLERDGEPAPHEGLEHLFVGAEIVALGDNSHGAQRLYDLKHRLVRDLVGRGFQAFVLEMPAVEARSVSAYVLGESDDSEAALGALTYPAWQSTEMWRLIEWLREHNRSAPTAVTFYGLDMGEPADVPEEMRQSGDEVARIAGEAGRVIVWGDNTLISEMPGTMGTLLDDRFGESYVSIGFTFGEGSYLAYGPEIEYEVHPPYPGTHEHVLAQAGLESFLLEVDRLPADHVLRRALGFRYLGSRPQELTQFLPHRLAEHFDLVGYVRSTESIQLLVEHEF